MTSNQGQNSSTYFSSDKKNEDDEFTNNIIDSNNNGIVDGSNLTAYSLYLGGTAILLTGGGGRTYNDSSSPSWDAIQAVHLLDQSWNILLQGSGTKINQWFVWTATSSGRINSGSGWKSSSEMKQLGYEEIFNRDFDGDGNIGTPIVDDNNDGLVDGSNTTAYQLYYVGEAFNLTNRSGRYNDSSTGFWDVIQAVRLESLNWKVLLEGTSTRENEWFVWTTNNNGRISTGSGWKTGTEMLQLGYENIFERDFNGDGMIGLNGDRWRWNRRWLHPTAYALYDSNTESSVTLETDLGENTTTQALHLGMLSKQS